MVDKEACRDNFPSRRRMKECYRGVIKRSGPASEEGRKVDWWWGLKGKRNLFPADDMTKRGDGKDEAPESIWKWNEKGGAANDAVAGGGGAGGGDGGLGRFKAREVATSHIKGKRNGIGADKQEGSEGGEDGRWGTSR